jgi:short-subunit dehydrogenase
MSKMALITGGSHGLGLAIAHELQKRGFDLLLTARDEEGLAKAKKSMTGDTRVEIAAGDITKSQDVGSVAQVCRDKFGRLDLLVNNAGIFVSGALAEFDEKKWNAIIGVSLTGSYLMTRAVLDLLKGSKGQIIFINSVGGKIGLKNLSGYSAAKHGLRGFADSLRLELKPDGIRVTSIFPHAMNTMVQDISSDEDRFKMLDPEDVAHMIGEVASSPVHAQIPEIVIYPRSTEIKKSEKVSDILDGK